MLETPNHCKFEQAESVRTCTRAREREGKQREGAASRELTQFGVGRCWLLRGLVMKFDGLGASRVRETKGGEGGVLGPFIGALAWRGG
jgi:hypothetical protein